MSFIRLAVLFILRPHGKSIIDFTKRIHRAAMTHAQVGSDVFQFINNHQTEILANLKECRFIAKKFK